MAQVCHTRQLRLTIGPWDADIGIRFFRCSNILTLIPESSMLRVTWIIEWNRLAKFSQLSLNFFEMC